MSYPSDNHASYDQALLSSVPGPTRQEKQEGYDVDLLGQAQDTSAPSAPANGAAASDGTVIGYSPGAVSYARKEDPTAAAVATKDYENVEKRVPWYRTRKGMIGIGVVVLIIIIAAAVGGGVGGSHHSHSSKNSGNATNGVGQSSNDTGVGQSGNSSATSTSSFQTIGGLSQVPGSPSPSPTSSLLLNGGVS